MERKEMTENNGYMGRILIVDLTSGAFGTVPTADYAARFIGGMGTASKIYWDEINPETEALDPGNILIFMTGPAVGKNFRFLGST
jgi:aldehyde:ferredoxin oxidoreductase